MSDVLSSRRVRVWLPVAVILTILFAFGARYDALPSAPTGWSKAGSSGTLPPSGGGVSLATEPNVDWSRFAYTQYVTDSHYLCNSVMLFERLQHVGSRADRVMMYPAPMLENPDATDGGSSDDARLLIKARDEYGAKLVPITVQRRASADKTWAESYTKLLAFNQTQYDRVLSLDSDSVLLQNMDELFLLPPCPVAMPRAYWLYPETMILSSQVMLVTPSEVEFGHVMDKINQAGRDDYDMEIVNYLYKDSALVLPHRPYDLLTGEFTLDEDKHRWYLGSDTEEWDPVKVFNEAKFLHFSDWPVPKPWLGMSDSVRQSKQPKCHVKDGVESCAEREIWLGIYREFVERRKRVCGRVAGEPLRRRRFSS
ncbi:glycosyltransferase family 8 protein [Parathielavia appendiculata]|uniref:Glycosyltransferase family 8 protein n=1 Tax=Parathielavia appendiculata TaxID=2587402 RepID=A0AAN6TSR5_9PEZI|nr:glycosyltransferase family 8 protein [Parathielavia appendiculata]